MPKAIGFGCSICGCSGVTVRDGLCARHLKNHIRDTQSDPFYHSTQWRKLRLYHISREPVCRLCGDIGTVVDHIKRIRDGGARLALENLQTLCDVCHNKKRSGESRGKYT